MKVKDLMNNEQLMNDVTEEISDISDETTVTYEVWAIGYDENEKATDAEMLIKSFDDPDEAIKCAKQLTLADIVHQAAEENDNAEPTNVKYIYIEVETVVEDEEGTMNIGTIFRAIHNKDCWGTKELDSESDYEEIEPIVELTESDYTLLEDGTLKVSCKLLKDYNKNDQVNFHFVGESQSFFCYKIMSRVMYEDGDYYHCDFMY